MKRATQDQSSSGLDAVDRQIVLALLSNGRMSVAEIAERVGISATPCWNRIRRLEQTGVIQGYGARVDKTKLGLALEVIVLVTLERHAEFTIKKFISSLSAIPEVIECVSLSGQHDAMLRVVVPDVPAFEKLLMQKLAKVPGVAHFSSSFVLRNLIERREIPL